MTTGSKDVEGGGVLLVAENADKELMAAQDDGKQLESGKDRIGVAPVGFVISAAFLFEVSVGGLLVLEALLPDRQLLLGGLLFLVLVPQPIAFSLWLWGSRQEPAGERGETRQDSPSPLAGNEPSAEPRRHREHARTATRRRPGQRQRLRG
jgi:hypothetical protein